MKRSGFTMIELIFVIVILGILAAVALPKFIGVSEQAQEGKIKAYVGTLNRTVAPALWSNSISTNLAGSVKNAASQTKLAEQLEPLTDIGDGGTDLAVPTLTTCSDFSATPQTDTLMMSWTSAGTVLVGGKTYTVRCMDGSMTAAPRFVLTRSDITTAPLVK